MSRTLSRLMMIVAFSSVPSLQMIAMEPETSQNPLSAISGASLTALEYLSSSIRSESDESNFYLYIPLQELIDIAGTKSNLKDLFEKNGLCTAQTMSDDVWTDKDWERNLSWLIDMQLEAPNKTAGFRYIKYLRYHERKCSLNELLGWLTDAKVLIKSFLGPDTISEGFMRKSGINRIFTYAKLRQVIAEKKLLHVRLPVKYVYIYDTITGEYLSQKEAEKVVDTTFKACIINGLICKIEFISDRYQLKIFASIEKKEGNGLSKATIDELFVLCKEAPFDIGHDNIFWDAKGDAIIIDTEYKGETEEVCGKVGRYPIDPNL